MVTSTTLLPQLAFGFSADSGAEAAKPSDTAVPGGLGSFFGKAADILLYLTGALAVLIIIFGGLRYVTSTGDAARVKSAKDTIVYGIIGVVVAILAYAVVKFITNNVVNPPAS